MYHFHHRFIPPTSGRLAATHEFPLFQPVFFVLDTYLYIYIYIFGHELTAPSILDNYFLFTVLAGIRPFYGILMTQFCNKWDEGRRMFLEGRPMGLDIWVHLFL